MLTFTFGLMKSGKTKEMIEQIQNAHSEVSKARDCCCFLKNCSLAEDLFDQDEDILEPMSSFLQILDTMAVKCNLRKIGVFKATFDTEDTSKRIVSRSGLQCSATDVLFQHDDLRQKLAGYDVVFIDEVQFLRPNQIEQLRQLVDLAQVRHINCFGLMTSAQDDMAMFTSSKKLAEIANKTCLVPSHHMCEICSTRLAVGHKKIAADRKLYDDAYSFQLVCWTCYHLVEKLDLCPTSPVDFRLKRN